jgi:hypothetical protein
MAHVPTVRPAASIVRLANGAESHPSTVSGNCGQSDSGTSQRADCSVTEHTTSPPGVATSLDSLSFPAGDVESFEAAVVEVVDALVSADSDPPHATVASARASTTATIAAAGRRVGVMIEP